MKESKFSVKQRIQSIRYAIEGIKTLFKEEHNARIHLFFAIAIIALGFAFQLNTTEWIFIVFAIGFVFVTEILNTSIENIANFISPQKHDDIKKIKDMAAAAVLVSSIIAIVVGLIIFGPKLWAIAYP